MGLLTGLQEIRVRGAECYRLLSSHRMACRINSVAFFNCSFSLIFARWLSTVFTEMCNRSEISLVEWP